MLSLTLVSKVFYACAYPLRHRHQTFAFKEDLKDRRSQRSHDILRGLLADPARKHILLSIQSISVTSIHKSGNLRVSALCDRSYKESHENKWLLMTDVLSKIPHLRTFTLQGTDQLSVAVLDALAKHQPQAHLHIQNWTRLEDDEDHNNPAELALAKSPNLKSLQARLWNTTTRIDLRQAALKRIVAISPALDDLDISTESLSLAPRQITVEEQLELSRRREKFSENVIVSSNSIRSLRARRPSDTNFLQDVTDTSILQTLTFGYLNQDFVSLAALWQIDKLPHLKHLTFALNDSMIPEVYQLMNDFLQTCRSLETLSVTDGANHIQLSTILFHGSTLRTLVLHELESSSSDIRRSITVSEIQWLSESCKMLEDITIDAGNPLKGEGWNEMLSTLAAFPFLHTIRIYMPLGVADEAARTPHIFLDEDETRAEIELHRSKPFKPIEDSRWLENAWSLLRHEKRRNGHKPLQEMHVKLGEWEREMSGGYPAGWVIWEAANRRYFTATPHERDDRPNNINVYIKGTKPYSNVDCHEIRRIPDFVDLWD